MPFYFLLSFFLLTVEVDANIEIVSISGASNYLIDENTVKVFAGTSGVDCRGNESTCDNCTGHVITEQRIGSCNENRINDLGGSLSINFSKSSPGFPIITNREKDTNLKPSVSEGEESSSASFISIRWNILCTYIVGNSNCDSDDAKGTIYVGLDADDDGMLSANEHSVAINITVSNMEDVVDMQTTENGISEFQIYPGDGKVYLLDNETDVYDDFEEGMNVLGTFPSYKGLINFNEIRLYYIESNSGCNDVYKIQNNSGYVSTNILELDGEGGFKVDKTFFSGFENKKQYVFKLALVDESGNVGLFTPNTSCEDRYHTATPDDVYGIFGDSDRCFIMETANASSLSPSIGILRKFRDKKLLGSNIGKRIVDGYYKYSPHMARLARENKILKSISKVLLIPVTIFAFVSTHIDFVWTAWLYTLFFILLRNRISFLHRGYQD